LLKKLQVNADVWIDEGLLQRQWAGSGVEEAGHPNTSDRARAVRAQVSSFEQQGFIEREGDRLKSHLEYKQGELTANGKPIGPAVAN
jgi:hypothetical protein